jgi:hypothetical protein
MIVMREQLSVEQRQAISETPAKGGGLVETCFSSLGRMVAFPGKRPWLGCCLQGWVLKNSVIGVIFCRESTCCELSYGLS